MLVRVIHKQYKLANILKSALTILAISLLNCHDYNSPFNLNQYILCHTLPPSQVKLAFLKASSASFQVMQRGCCCAAEYKQYSNSMPVCQSPLCNGTLYHVKPISALCNSTHWPPELIPTPLLSSPSPQTEERLKNLFHHLIPCPKKNIWNDPLC